MRRFLYKCVVSLGGCQVKLFQNFDIEQVPCKEACLEKLEFALSCSHQENIQYSCHACADAWIFTSESRWCTSTFLKVRRAAWIYGHM